MGCCYAAQSQVLLTSRPWFRINVTETVSDVFLLPAFFMNSSYQNDIMVLLLQFASALLGSKKDMPLQHCKKTQKPHIVFQDITFCIIFTIDKTNWSNHWTQKMSVATLQPANGFLSLMACLLHVIRTFSSQTLSVSHDFAVFLPCFFFGYHETQGGNTGIPGCPNTFNVTQVFEDLKSLVLIIRNSVGETTMGTHKPRLF